jgi:ribosomal protein S18 acetylase RimI-like enzyme
MKPVSPSPSIRLCGPGDEVALSLIGQATFLETFAGILYGQDILLHCARQHASEKYATWLNDPASTLWIAETEPGQAPVGYLVLTTPDLPTADLSPDDIEVKRVYLLHRFHGGGIGSRLMEEARKHAIARGHRRLLLGVYGRNTAAIQFYEKLGYRRVGERSFKVGENIYQDLILGLALTI